MANLKVLILIALIPLLSACDGLTPGGANKASTGNGEGYGGLRNSLITENEQSYDTNQYNVLLPGGAYYRLLETYSCLSGANLISSHAGRISQMGNQVLLQNDSCNQMTMPISGYEIPAYNREFLGYLGGIFERLEVEPDPAKVREYNMVWCRSNEDLTQGTDFVIKKIYTDPGQVQGASVDIDVSAATLDSRLQFTRSSVGTYFDSQGIIRLAAENEMRIEYDPDTKKLLGAKIEPGRTNLQPNSENISSVDYRPNDVIVTVNQAMAPDGTMNADKMAGGLQLEHKGTSTSLVAGSSSDRPFTCSAFAKYAGVPGFRVTLGRNRVQDTLPRAYGWTTVNIQTGASGVSLEERGKIVNSTIQKIGNGWFRSSVSVIVDTEMVEQLYCNFSMIRRLVGRDSSSLWQGNGIDGIHLWGIQVEEGSFPTSYIPTTTMPVARAADNLQIVDVQNWFNSLGGSLLLFGHFDSGINQDQTLLSVTDAADQNRINVTRRGQDKRVSAEFVIGGEKIAEINSFIEEWAQGESKKILLAQDNQSAEFYSNGLFVGDNFSRRNTFTASQMLIGRNSQATSYWNGHFRRLVYWPKKLVSNEISVLTTPGEVAFQGIGRIGGRSQSGQFFRREIRRFPVRIQMHSNSVEYVSDSYHFQLNVLNKQPGANKTQADLQTTIDQISFNMPMQCRSVP